MREKAVGWIYGACVLGIFASILGQEFPPCVDYPQHLALAKQLRDLLLGQGEAHWVVWNYNGLFHLTTASLALVLPLELAGRFVLAGSIALTALSVWKVVQVSYRPAAYAFAWLPFAYSQSFAWGFVNFTLSVALATLAVLVWCKRRSSASFVALSLLTALAHPLGLAVVVAGSVVVVVTGGRGALALSLLLPAIGWAMVSHAANDPAPHVPWGNDILWPEWSQRLGVLKNLLGPWHGPTDEWLAMVTVGILSLGLVLSLVQRRGRLRTPPEGPFGYLTVGALLVYSLGPLCLFGCWYLYQRAGYCLLLWLPALLARRSGGRWEMAISGALVLLGVAGTGNFVRHQLRDVEIADARAIINAVPIGVSVAPVMDIEDGSSSWRALRGAPVTDKTFWGHFPAYLVVRRNAEITWMWSREHLYFPVRQPSRGELGFPPEENAWAREFRPDADYAHKYRHVLVRTTHTEPDYNPAKNVFGENSSRAIELAHHGRFWLFEFMPVEQ